VFSYILRRVLYAVPILLGVAVFTFLLFYATVSPEQMARRNLSARNPTPAQIHEWLKEHGYDRPRSEQLRRHVQELFLLRFGRSDTTGEEIWGRIRAGVGPSFAVGVLVFTAALVVDLTFALLLAYFRGTYVDLWGTLLCVLLMSITYLLYIMGGQYLLGKVLRYGPMAGFLPGVEGLKFLMLPVSIAVVAGLGSTVRLYRTFILDETTQDYVRTARAKGVSEAAVMFRHVLRNAAIPILTSVVLAIPFLLTGSLLLESFFAIPGLGSYLVDGINSQDFAVVRAMTFLGSILFIIGAILTDIAYALADPRVRLE
jgi:peptide/nickel transport system permease protein